MSQPPVPPQPPPDPDATMLVPSARGRARGMPASPSNGSLPMPQPDARGDSDATLIAPSSYHRPGQAAPAAGSATITAAAPQDDWRSVSGLNRLVEAANPLLAAVPRIRTTVAHPDPSGLREQLIRSLQAFETGAQAAGIRPESVLISRYALCTLLDEAVAMTPWGGTANWAQASLLVTFHRETWGGEKFFQILDRLLADPTSDPDLLELFYVCLALGFEGRYRVIDNGRAQLDQLRERLYGVIRGKRGDHERELSPHWTGVHAPIRSGRRFLGLWASAAVAMALLIGVFVTLKVRLGVQSDPVFSTLAAASAPKVAVERRVPDVAVEPRLSRLLASEIAARQVEVFETAAESRVRLGGGLFAPGSASVDPAFVPVVRRVGEALNGFQGRVVVEGHTDNRPIRTVRFPSNFELSQERARAVLRVLAPVLADAGRLHAEGLADANPIAPNDTEDNRRRNRRVEIVVKMAD